MGLDINVVEPELLGDKNPNDVEDFLLIDENPELEIFKDFIFERENGYYDIDLELKKYNRTVEEVEQISIQYGDNVTFTFNDLKHPLYDAEKWLSNVWHKTYFAIFRKLRTSEYFIKFQKDYLDLLKQHGWKEEYAFWTSGKNRHYHNLVSAHNFCREAIQIKIVNPATFNKIERVLTYKDISWQRKGANKNFYEDDMWDAPCVVDLKTLTEHWNKYFSGDGTYGSDENRAEFKKNIIDEFIEGKNFVMYC